MMPWLFLLLHVSYFRFDEFFRCSWCCATPLSFSFWRLFLRRRPFINLFHIDDFSTIYGFAAPLHLFHLDNSFHGSAPPIYLFCFDKAFKTTVCVTHLGICFVLTSFSKAPCHAAHSSVSIWRFFQGVAPPNCLIRFDKFFHDMKAAQER